ncbi:MAG: hypothetical protein Q4B93_03955 [Clostridia bacterium]|nr:hypothetical protein [Clostridia bacterium]
MDEIRNEPVEHSASKEVAKENSEQEYEYVKPNLMQSKTVVEPLPHEPLPHPHDDTLK